MCRTSARAVCISTTHPHLDVEERVAVAVTSGGGVEHHDGERPTQDAGVAELLPSTSDWVPDGEAAPLNLLKEQPWR